MPGAEIKKRRAVDRLIGDRVHTGVVAGQETLFLKSVADQFVVGIGGREPENGSRVLPSEPTEQLPDV